MIDNPELLMLYHTGRPLAVIQNLSEEEMESNLLRTVHTGKKKECQKKNAFTVQVLLF